jgi:hypothetical protein
MTKNIYASLIRLAASSQVLNTPSDIPLVEKSPIVLVCKGVMSPKTNQYWLKNYLYPSLVSILEPELNDSASKNI